MKQFLLALAFVLSSSLGAAEAVFSGSGSKIYLLPLGDGAFVNVIDIEAREITQRSLVDWAGKHPVVGLSRSSGEQILFCTSSSVWEWSASRNSASKVCPDTEERDD